MYSNKLRQKGFLGPCGPGAKWIWSFFYDYDDNLRDFLHIQSQYLLSRQSPSSQPPEDIIIFINMNEHEHAMNMHMHTNMPPRICTPCK